jgi:ABC-type bacteriocin/lantibiotic exporter with double-glycine peptidase domain
LGGGYLLTGYLVRLRIKNNSNAISENQTQSVKYMQEGLGGIREVILDGSQAFFSQTYAHAVSKLQYAGMENIFLSSLPKALLELAGIILLTVLAYFLQRNSSGQQQVLPLLGALALGAQRLLPGLQQVYFSWSFISGSQATLLEVAAWLGKLKPSAQAEQLVQPLPFNSDIVLHNVSFQYAGTDQPVLEDICLTIPKGARIGFVGTTGSGKSTLLDLVMGLLVPTQGHILVDGVPIDQNNVRAWQQNIAHVSQSIFLADSSILENIAFGIAANKIDFPRAKEAAQMAQLDTFIEETLPMGYQTLVGERGVRLSGGQRQRIGIARALYKQAKVLVLDEATSALDGATEKEVIKNIYEANRNDLTVFSIAHRLSTIEGSDYILEIANRNARYTT